MDWRFLLPNPKPKKSIIFVEGVLAEAVRHVSSKVVKPGYNCANQSCDLAVLSDPDDYNLDLAYSSLEPGGYLYAEWGIRSFSSSKSIEKKLKSAGFELIELYLPASSPHSKSRNTLISLLSKMPIDYILNYKFLPMYSNFLTRRFRSLYFILSSISAQILVAYPGLLRFNGGKTYISSIGRKPLSSQEYQILSNKDENLNKTALIYNSMNSISQTTELSLKTLGLYKSSKAKPKILINPGDRIFNKSLLLVFAENKPKPSIVVKYTRAKEYCNGLISEARILRTLNNQDTIIKGIPRVLSCSYKSGIFSLGESYLDGIQLPLILTTNNYRELSLKVTSWLIDFATSTKTILPDDWKTSLVKNVILDIASLSCGELEHEFINKTKEVLMRLNVPNLICEHNDFAPQNIHIDDLGRIKVLDWESSRLSGLPGVDLILFLTYMNWHYHKAWSTNNEDSIQLERKLYREMLNESTFTGKITKECLDLYASRVGISNSSMDAIRLITWLLRLHERIPNSIDDSKYKSFYEFLEYRFEFALWQEEILYLKESQQ